MKWFKRAAKATYDDLPKPSHLSDSALDHLAQRAVDVTAKLANFDPGREGREELAKDIRKEN